jgi:hypothetical protein
VSAALLLLGFGCAGSESVPPCEVGDGAGAVSTCATPQQEPEWYEEQALLYFDTLESDFEVGTGPDYAPGVARWEWPPWLKLTGYGSEEMEQVDAVIRIIPTSVPVRDCQAFDVQPFARCRVEFHYEDHPGLPCPIYEEFTFNDAGQTTFIEAWSDDPSLLPMADSADEWGEGETSRLSTRIPGLGSPDGALDLDAAWMSEAAANDPDVLDFVTRAQDFYGTWLEEYLAAEDDVFEAGCGWL